MKTRNLQYTKAKSLVLATTMILLYIGLPANLYGQNEKSDTTIYNWERFSVTAGGFITGLNNDLLLGSQRLGVGVVVNLEDALGLETNNVVFRSDATYIFGKRNRHAINAGYFGFFRAATKTIEEELIIGEEVFPVGTEVDSRFDLQIIRAAYNYSYFTDERVKLGASFGLFVMPISFSTTALNSSASATEFTAPLPVLGLNANFAITPKLYFRQRIELLYLSIQEFTGSINDINIRLEYYPWNHFAVGVGYNSFQLNITAEEDGASFIDFIGKIESGYTGLLLYGKYSF